MYLGFPVFVLVLFVCDTIHYARVIVPLVYQLKLDYFGHESVVLHSIDIRKAQKSFGFLTSVAARQPFYERINGIMRASDYSIIAVGIRKQAYVEHFGPAANNPYSLAMTSALATLVLLLEDTLQTDVVLVAEARGKAENKDLLASFQRVIAEGTPEVSAERFQNIQFRLLFQPKEGNVIGTQIADLVAYPLARHILDGAAPNPAYEIIRDNIYVRNGMAEGLKVFP